jgi:threonine dehydratase
MPSPPLAISIEDVHAAAKRIETHIVRTPTVVNERVSKELNCHVYFKAENLQHVGAFKARGATNAVLALDDEVARRGVVTHSSGNHAAALARAASLRQIPAYVVMPHNSAAIKIDAVRSHGIEPLFCEPTAESRAATAESLRRQTGATLVHPYDDPAVMSGQGTVGLELMEQLSHLDAIFVPVGGGGLLSGVLIAVKSRRPEVVIVAAEPALADDTARSLHSGRVESPTRYDTVADGLRTPVGQLTFPIIKSLVDDIILVSEESIRAATRTLAERVRLVAEPSGAVALAALTTGAERFAGQSVAVVVSGGNLDWDSLSQGATEPRTHS